MKVLFLALVVAGSVVRLADWGTDHRADSSSFRQWLDEGGNEIERQAAPLPQLLFTMHSSIYEKHTYNIEWLTDEELRPFQERVNPYSYLMDLTNQMAVLDPAFCVLVTTDGLITDIDCRPKDPIPACHCIRHRRFDAKPRWEFFWLKNLPAPAALHSMSFTSESMSEKDTLRWKASWNRSGDLMRS
ncbi:hypothetical protein [Prosthecobacter sp.]|uniref:hypothetical protein n=1 Tax=Prosthecobacter sp. TaxID=1965333 RepID=UPI003784EADE